MFEWVEAVRKRAPATRHACVLRSAPQISASTRKHRPGTGSGPPRPTGVHKNRVNLNDTDSLRTSSYVTANRTDSTPTRFGDVEARLSDICGVTWDSSAAAQLRDLLSPVVSSISDCSLA